MAQPQPTAEQKGSAQLATSAALFAILVLGAVLLTLGLRRPVVTAVDTRLSTGTHLTFVFVAPTSRADETFVVEVKKARDAMRAYALAAGYLYSTVGISDDWSVDRAVELLREFGPFDELVVGRNWLNSGVERYVSRPDVRPAVPQILVTLQRIEIDSLPFLKGPVHDLHRAVGRDEFYKWAKAGFPITGPPRPLDSSR